RLRALPKIDYPSSWLQVWCVVKFTPSDVGEQHLAMAAVSDKHGVLRGQRGAFRLVILEDESLSVRLTAKKCLALSLAQRRRILIVASRQKERCHSRHGLAVEYGGTQRVGLRIFEDMHNADDNRGLPRPPYSSPRLVDHTPILHDLIKPRQTCVALRDRLGGKKAKRGASTQQAKRPPEEVGDKIALAA